MTYHDCCIFPFPFLPFLGVVRLSRSELDGGNDDRLSDTFAVEFVLKPTETTTGTYLFVSLHMYIRPLFIITLCSVFP